MSGWAKWKPKLRLHAEAQVALAARPDGPKVASVRLEGDLARRRSYMRGTVGAEEAVQDPPTERNTKRAPGLRQSVSRLGTYFLDVRQI